MKNVQRLNLERVCFAFAFGISGNKEIECLHSLFQVKFFNDVSNDDYFINKVLPVFEMNYEKIKDKDNEMLKKIETEIKMYLIKMCVKYVDSTDLLKHNKMEFEKFKICVKILQKMTNNRLKYGQRLLNKINCGDVNKGGDNNNNSKVTEGGDNNNYHSNNDVTNNNNYDRGIFDFYFVHI
jgi:hypothetical protein